MKLRIKGDSLRLRITPSEMTRLLQAGRIEETVHFGMDEAASLTYGLEASSQAAALSVRAESRSVTVMVPADQLRRWAASSDEGLYGQVKTAHGALQLSVEKDFACLDKSDAENHDTFPNPLQGSVC